MLANKRRALLLKSRKDKRKILINEKYISSKKSVIPVSDNTPKAILSFETYYMSLPIEKSTKAK